jgi:putative Mg2+ transporter-C (MgtC) family protein
MNLINLLSTAPQGQTFIQIGELTLALVLSTLIGLEREIRMKSAGLRTHTLVGVAAALIMLVSKYGFGNIIVQNQVVLDPSRIAAQIVSGIGFIGGGLIFVQRDVVRGLTTAAAIWLTAAVGMACGAGLPVLALFVTAAYFLIMYGYARLTRRILSEQSELLVHYLAGKGAVREIMKLCTGRAFSINDVTAHEDNVASDAGKHVIRLRLHGRGDLNSLVVAIGDIQGVISVRTPSAEDPAVT